MSADIAHWVGKVLANGRYQISSCLGAGGMGFVLGAWDQHLKCQVVIKVPRVALRNPTLLRRFAAEVQSLVQLSHPNIVKVLDAGEHGGTPFAVLQFLSGGSLRDRLRATPTGEPQPLPPTTLRPWLATIAAALDFIHQQGYLHRDIKPDNILFDAHQQVYLSDFGIAKALASQTTMPAQTALTQLGAIVGTPGYLAPEAIANQKMDGRVDQYALAVTVYEVLAGRPPFEGPAPLLLGLHATQKPRDLRELQPGLPEGLCKAVLRALAKDPAQRFTTCTEFAQAVLTAKDAPAPVRSHAPFAVETEPWVVAPKRSRRPARSRSWLIWGLLLALLAGGAAASWMASRQVPTVAKDPSPSPPKVVVATPRKEVERPASPTGVLPQPKASTAEPLPPPAPDPAPPMPPPQPAPVPLQLGALDPLAMDVGSLMILRVAVERGRATDPVRVSLEGLPAGVTAKQVQLDPQDTVAEIQVQAAPDAAAGEYAFRVVAVRGAERVQTAGRLTLRVPDQLFSLEGHGTQVDAVAFSPDGRQLATADTKGLVLLWNLQTGTVDRRLEGHRDAVWVLAFSPDGRTLLSGGGGRWEPGGWIRGDDFAARQWEVSTGQVRVLPNNKSRVAVVGFSADGRLGYSRDDGNQLRLWDIATGKASGKFAPGVMTPLYFSADGRWFVGGGIQATLWEGTLTNARLVQEFPAPARGWPIATHLSAQNIVSAFGNDRFVYRWSAVSRQLLNRFEISPDGCWSNAFSPDGRLFATGSDSLRNGGIHTGKDFDVRIWNTQTGKVVQVFKGHRQTVVGLAFSADGRLLASSSTDGTARVWRIRP